MKIAFVGCGFVADFYRRCVAGHPELELTGVFDRNREHRERFSRYFGVATYPDLDQLLADDQVEMVVNLTSVESHYEVNRRSLEAGKHVFSEKPLATSFDHARELVELAERLGLGLSGAPSTLLSPAAQTLWKLARSGEVGRIRLAYVEMEDGNLRQSPYRSWRSESGAIWPYENEVRTGCVLEHAPYPVSWLTAMFGPVVSLTAHASSRYAEEADPSEDLGSDFSVAILEHASGVVSRLTNGRIAPRNQATTLIGDLGTLQLRDRSDDRSAVFLRRARNLRRRRVLLPPRRRALLKPDGAWVAAGRRKPRDFAVGILELAAAIEEGRESRLSSRFCLHTTEVVLAIDGAGAGAVVRPSTTFEPVAPMPWAED